MNAVLLTIFHSGHLDTDSRVSELWNEFSTESRAEDNAGPYVLQVCLDLCNVHHYSNMWEHIR